MRFTDYRAAYRLDFYENYFGIRRNLNEDNQTNIEKGKLFGIYLWAWANPQKKINRNAIDECKKS